MIENLYPPKSPYRFSEILAEVLDPARSSG
jgi:hypothetical protein